jgi:hypothetical protein
LPFHQADKRANPKRSLWPHAEAAQAFWNDAKDDFKIGQKYATDMRIYEVEGVAQK